MVAGLLLPAKQVPTATWAWPTYTSTKRNCGTHQKPCCIEDSHVFTPLSKTH
jgi:hypothetical protein